MVIGTAAIIADRHMAIRTKRPETGWWQRIRRAVDNGSYGHPWQTGFICRFDNPVGVSISTAQAPLFSHRSAFLAGIGNDMMASDQFALLRWKLFGNGGLTELLD